MVNILVTGSKGFIGKNLIATLQCISDGRDKRYEQLRNINIMQCDIETSDSELESFAKSCDFVFHLAGINRPINAEEFMIGNYGFTTQLLDKLIKCDSQAPILMSSSIQAELNNEYGLSKRAGEQYLMQYGADHGVETYIFRLPNVFGKWCRPNYNSAVATFCHNKANDLPIIVNNNATIMTLVYIDDVVNSFIDALIQKVERDADGYCKVGVEHIATLGDIITMLDGFVAGRDNKMLPIMTPFAKKLYATYLSYLPKDGFAYELKMNIDERGSFTEAFKTETLGQTSINISKPYVVKGNHWHHTKNEKFLVVSGVGIIRFRKIGEKDVTEYRVSGDELTVVDIPCGYTHNIENVGDTDMVTVMWANEAFDPSNPDTFCEEV